MTLPGLRASLARRILIDLRKRAVVASSDRLTRQASMRFKLAAWSTCRLWQRSGAACGQSAAGLMGSWGAYARVSTNPQRGQVATFAPSPGGEAPGRCPLRTRASTARDAAT